MIKIMFWPRHFLTLGIFIGCISSAAAAPVEIIEDDTAMVESLHSHLTRSFVLPKELAIDPELRVAADKISADHLVRIRRLLPVWVQEERKLQTRAAGRASSSELFFAVWARFLNELALWQIDAGDAEYEKTTLEVLKTSPLACRTAGDPRFHDFLSRIKRLQEMPSAKQQAALAMERQLLERWGKPRPAAQPWPNPLPQDAGMLAVAQIKSGGSRPPLALPPLLASALLAKGLGYNDLAWGDKCAFQQWWLRVSLAQGGTPAAVLSAFRYATLITATDRFKGLVEFDDGEVLKERAHGTRAYPKLGARFGVYGETEITRRFDPSGRPEHASVTGREIKVPGVRGMRPVAFENTFDALAVHYALEGGDPAKTGNASPKVFKMVWSLEPRAPSAAKANPTSKGETP